MNCEHIKTDGNQCQAKPIKGSVLCFSHNPKTKNAKQRAVQKGGQAKKVEPQCIFSAVPKLNERQDILDVLSITIQSIGNGDISSQQGNAIVYATNTALSVLQQEKKEEEVERVPIGLMNWMNLER